MTVLRGLHGHAIGSKVTDPIASAATAAHDVAGATEGSNLIPMSLLTDLFKDRTRMVDADRALPGRDTEIPVPDRHFVLGTPLRPPFPEGMQSIVVGMGCFWGAERVFWQAPGIHTTAVGYAGGFTPNPTYEEVCSGSTGHAEVVLAVFDPAKTSYD